MRRATLVSTTSGYNLGLHKLGTWLSSQGWEATYSRDALLAPADLYAFSAIFSWDLPDLIRQVNWVRGSAEVWIGGPACAANSNLIRQQTGVSPHVGPDYRFEEQPGEYRLLRTTRGCAGSSTGPCYACPVPHMDGREMRLLSYSLPVQLGTCCIIDDNIAQAPKAHHQALTTQLTRYRSIDLNSGWEPWWWREWMWDLWRGLPLVAWRTAFDGIHEEDDVGRLLSFWRSKGIPRKKIWVYVLAGGAETFDQASDRAQKVVQWGGEPRIQSYRPSNLLKPRSTPFLQPEKGWTRERVINLPRYYYGYYWRRMAFAEFLKAQRKRRRDGRETPARHVCHT